MCTFASLLDFSQSALFSDLSCQFVNPSPLPRSIPLRLFRCHNLYFRAVDCRPLAQPPAWRCSPPYLYPPKQGGPAIPPGTRYPFSSPGVTCTDCSGTVFFPSHHTGKYPLIMIEINKWPKEQPRKITVLLDQK